MGDQLKVKIRDVYLDTAKGLAIVLVVFGHAIQQSTQYFDDNLFFKLIYSFHMPFFIFVSGAVASLYSGTYDFRFISKKFNSLVVPFLAWTVIAYFLNSGSSSESPLLYLKGVLVNPDRSLWFLWVLFLIYVIVAIAVRLKAYVGSLSYVCTGLILYTLPASKFGLNLVRWHLPFFVLGFLTYKFIRTYSNRNKIYTVLVICIYFSLFYFWKRTGQPVFYNQLSTYLSHTPNGGNIIIADFVYVNLLQLITLLYRYIIALSGIALALIATWYLSRLRINKLLSTLGGMSLGIYASSNYFLELYGKNLDNQVLIISILSLASSALLTKFILVKFQVTNRVLLGGR